MITSDTLRFLRSAARALLAQGSLHAELLCLEWAEERSRLLRMVVLSLVGLLFLLCSLLSIAAAVIILSWGTSYQDEALYGLVGFFLLGTLVIWWRVRALAQQGEDAFAGTIAEVSADLALIKDRLGD